MIVFGDPDGPTQTAIAESLIAVTVDRAERLANGPRAKRPVVPLVVHVDKSLKWQLPEVDSRHRTPSKGAMIRVLDDLMNVPKTLGRQL